MLHQKPASAAMLTTGLPLPKQRLSVELLPRAAARAGLQGRVLQRKLEEIPAIAMPALLLLKDGRSAVLLGWQGDHEARVLLSETDGGPQLLVNVQRYLAGKVPGVTVTGVDLRDGVLNVEAGL